MEVSAQSFNTRLYTIEDGLPDNYIFSIYQDSNGYLWIGTNNGLSRFDGTKFVNYGISRGLPSLQVDRIYEDSKHRLWIGTRLGMAELKADSFYTYPVKDGLNIRFVHNFMETPGGEIWALTDQGVYRYEKQAWEKISLYPGFDNKSIQNIVATPQGTYLMYDNRKLVFRETDGKYRVLSEHLTTRPFFNGLRLNEGNVFAGTFHGLYQITSQGLKSIFEDSLKNRFLYGSYIDSRKRFWFATEEDGIFLITGTTGKYQCGKIPLSINLVSNFYEDRDHNIWAACVEGLLKISDAGYQVLHIPAFQKSENVMYCFALSDHQLLASGSSGKIILLGYSQTDNGLKATVHKTYVLDPGDFIDFCIQDNFNRHWFTTRQSELYCIDQGILKKNTQYIPGSQRKEIRGIGYDAKQNKLLICADSVLLEGTDSNLDTLWDATKKKFIPLPAQTMAASDGSYLVQTLKEGTYKMGTDHNLVHLNELLHLSQQYSPSAFKEDVEKKMWMYFPGIGLRQFNWAGLPVPLLLQTVGLEEGLPEYGVRDFLVDKHNRLWVITGRNLLLFQKMQQSWVKTTIETGNTIPTAKFLFAHLTEDPDGFVWVNAPEFLLRFDTVQSSASRQNLQVVIEEIRLNNQAVSWKEKTDSTLGYRQFPVDPVLQHYQNTITIRFNAIGYGSREPYQYSWQLFPTDSGWNHAGSYSEVSLYQLKAGKYRFLVKAREPGGKWTEAAVFGFTILKPFWETGWFRGLLVLLASGFILLLFRVRLSAINRKNKLNEQLRELEMKALKSQMNPHFIHNALNSIQSLILNQRSGEAAGYISKFARLLRQVFENADSNLVLLEKELYSLGLYVDLEKLRLDANLEYQVELADNIDADHLMIPPLILQPFVENAIWHGLAKKEGEKKLQVKIREEEEYILCTITDNGIGRKKAAENYSGFPEGHLSRAVAVTTRRLEEYNQDASHTPVVYADLGDPDRPEGTRVTLWIRRAQ